MLSKKLTAIPLLLVTILSIIGIAYAHWDQTLYINAEVETGELDWEFTSAYDNDDGIDPGKDKDVADTTVELIDSDNDGDDDTLKVTITNAYPCYKVSICFWVHNCGTIPLKIWKLIVKYRGIEEEFYDIFTKDFDIDGDGKADIRIEYGNNFGTELDPCEGAGLSFTLYVLQDAPQDSELSFTMELVAIQWNA